MTLTPARDVVGSRITLGESGEGWFDGYADLSGTIESAIQSNDNPCYVVEFDLPLELQDSGAATVSGCTLRRYSRCVIQCRWQGMDVNAGEPVSVHVRLVEEGSAQPMSIADVLAMSVRVWANCALLAGASTCQ